MDEKSILTKVSIYCTSQALMNPHNSAFNEVLFIINSNGFSIPKTAVILCELLIGLPEDKAASLCQMNGFICRLVAQDDEEYIVTADFRLDRINIRIRDNVVVEAYEG